MINKVKVPFHTVLFNSEKILSGIILKSTNLEDDYYDEYIAYLHMCGWEENEFDKELLKLVDKDFLDMWRRAFFTIH